MCLLFFFRYLLVRRILFAATFFQKLLILDYYTPEIFIHGRRELTFELFTHIILTGSLFAFEKESHTIIIDFELFTSHTQ